MSEQPSAGGSAAGQSYRAELKQQAEPIDGAVAGLSTTTPLRSPPSGPPQEARAAERKLISGRVRVLRASAQTVHGKMIDISETGACVVLDCVLPSMAACMLEVEIFHNGRHHAFSAPARAVYSVFSSGKGFKVGFQFGSRSPQASMSIAALVA